MAGIDNLKRTKKFDDRLFQSPPTWVVEEGAVSLSAANFQSLSATAGQVTFQIQAPSKAVYLDRVVDWKMTVYCTAVVDMSLLVPTVAAPAVVPLFPVTVATPGVDFALCASPLHSLVTSIQATICDQQVSSNLAQNREIMQLLTDSPVDRAWRTYPTYLDTYSDYNDAYGTNQNPLSSFDSATDVSQIGNGAWPVTFLTPAYAAFSPSATYQSNGYTVTQLENGLPAVTAVPGVAPASALVQIYFTFTTTEPLQLSPFIWREFQERRTGLSQLQNLNIVMNMQTPQQARLIRWTSANKRSFASVGFGSYQGTPFAGAGLTSQFLSPPLTSELPYQAVNTVDYQNIQAYVYPAGSQTGAPASRLTTQTLSLNTIPDWIVVAVQPLSSWATLPQNGHYGTFYIPILSISLSWSNVSGLLSTQSQEQLYHMCKANRLKMSYAQWRGFANTANGVKSLTGGPLVMRPGVDLTLPPGQASGQSNGQWTFQADITVDLSHLPSSIVQTDAAFGLQTTVIAINSGFFTTSSGSSRIVTGPVDGPAAKGGNPEDMFALANIPSSGPLYRPGEIALTALERTPGAGGGAPHAARRRGSMSHRVRHRR